MRSGQRQFLLNLSAGDGAADPAGLDQKIEAVAGVGIHLRMGGSGGSLRRRFRHRKLTKFRQDFFTQRRGLKTVLLTVHSDFTGEFVDEFPVMFHH